MSRASRMRRCARSTGCTGACSSSTATCVEGLAAAVRAGAAAGEHRHRLLGRRLRPDARRPDARHPVRLPRRAQRARPSTPCTRVVSPEELYAANGLQHLPFNTAVPARRRPAAGTLDLADSFLLIPDLLGYWLTGRSVAERTNASTTGLLGVETGEWDFALIERLGIPRGIFRSLVDAGTELGGLAPSAVRGVGLHARRGDHGRIARHGVRDRRDPGIRPRLRLHLERHLVARRRRARAPGAHRGQPPRRTSPTRAASTGACATCTT